MNIHHIAITVSSLEESVQFYTDIFGFLIYTSFGREDMGAQAVMLKLGECILELWQFDDMVENQDDLSHIRVKGIRHIAFGVEQLDQIVSMLRAQKIPVSDPIMGASKHRYSFTQDPNGVALELYEA